MLSTHVRSQAQWRVSIIQHWRGKDRKTLGPAWSANAAESVRSRFKERPGLKSKMGKWKGNRSLGSLNLAHSTFSQVQ